MDIQTFSHCSSHFCTVNQEASLWTFRPLATAPPTSELVYWSPWVRIKPEDFLPYIPSQAEVLGFKCEPLL